MELGPEIMEATLNIITSAGGKELILKPIEVGEKVYSKGNTSGIDTGCVGIAPQNQSIFKSSDNYASGRRL